MFPVEFTPKQGQYLAFIYAYTTINDYAPAVTDLQRFFGVSGATAHNMVVRLADLGLLARIPGAARSIEILIPPESLPVLRRPKENTSWAAR